jgi:hypothetical protein
MRRSLLAVALLAAALPAAACGGSTGAGSAATTTTTTITTTTSAGGDAVAWVDKVCGAIVKLVDTQTTPPAIVVNDPAQRAKAVDTYLADSITAVDRSISDLRNVGPSPVAGGDDGVNALIKGLESLKSGFQTTRTKLSSADLNNPQQAGAAVSEAVIAIQQGAQEMNTATQSLEKNQALQDAAKKAPNCQKLENTAGASATRTS